MLKITAFLFLLLFGAGVARADSCSCVPGPFDYRWKTADAVFVGHILGIRIADNKSFAWGAGDDPPVKIEIKVDHAYKGTKDNEIFFLHTSLTKNTCAGYTFEPGGRYLFYAYQRRYDVVEKWSLYNFPSGTYGEGGLCGGTTLAGESVEVDLRRIEKRVAQEKARDKDSLFGRFRD